MLKDLSTCCFLCSISGSVLGSDGSSAVPLERREFSSEWDLRVDLPIFLGTLEGERGFFLEALASKGASASRVAWDTETDVESP